MPLVQHENKTLKDRSQLLLAAYVKAAEVAAAEMAAAEIVVVVAAAELLGSSSSSFFQLADSRPPLMSPTPIH